MTLDFVPLPTPNSYWKKLYLECLNDFVYLSSQSMSTLSDEQISLVDDELWSLFLKLKTRKEYFESLDLPEYHEDNDQLLKIIRKMVIVRRFIKEVDREKTFRLFKGNNLLSDQYESREEFKGLMTFIKNYRRTIESKIEHKVSGKIGGL